MIETAGGLRGKVVTVVLNFNQCALTRDMLESLREGRGADNHVLLIDNASSDGSAENLRREFPEVEVIEPGENLGCSGGRNHGARAAVERGADYIFFCDNDAFVAEDCISRLRAHLDANPQVGIVGARVMAHPDREAIVSLGTVVDWDRCRYRSNQEEPGEIPEDGLLDSAWVAGTAWMVRAALFGEMGYIDDRYFIYFEDTDFSFRIRSRGLRVVVAPDAVVWHRERSSLGPASPRSAYYYTRNRILFFTTYSPRPLFSGWFLVTRALAWAARLAARGEWRLTGAVLSGLGDAALGRWGRRYM